MRVCYYYYSNCVRFSISRRPFRSESSSWWLTIVLRSSPLYQKHTHTPYSIHVPCRGLGRHGSPGARQGNGRVKGKWLAAYVIIKRTLEPIRFGSFLLEEWGYGIWFRHQLDSRQSLFFCILWLSFARAMDCGEIKQTTRSKTSKTHRVRWAKVADSPQNYLGPDTGDVHVWLCTGKPHFNWIVFCYFCWRIYELREKRRSGKRLVSLYFFEVRSCRSAHTHHRYVYVCVSLSKFFVPFAM
jgi:hypothetical protein